MAEVEGRDWNEKPLGFEEGREVLDIYELKNKQMKEA